MVPFYCRCRLLRVAIWVPAHGAALPCAATTGSLDRIHTGVAAIARDYSFCSLGRSLRGSLLQLRTRVQHIGNTTGNTPVDDWEKEEKH